MKVLIFIFQLAVFTTCCAQETPIPVQSIILKLPACIEKVLLRKTGAKSVISVSELAYRKCDQFEVLAAVIELENYPDIKGDIVEGIMHARAVFITQKDGSVKIYDTDEQIQTVVYAKEDDMKRLIKPIK